MLVNILREYNINRIFLCCLGLWPFQCKLVRCWLPMLLFVIQISHLPFEIIYVLDQIEEMIRFMFIMTGALLQLMVVCYSGQKLMDESQNIFHRAYAAEWYKFSPRLKSLLIIILYRSIVPSKLTAGNLFPLSMAVFAAVIRAGISYFTAFLSLQI